VHPAEPNRRPIQARNSRWAAASASWLARRGVRPNTISVFSAVFAALGGMAFACTARFAPAAAAALFVAGAVGVQLRLLCNLFDGMVAVEGGFRTKSGEVFNELPDRFADLFILIGCGYAAAALPWGVTLGWAAGALAVTTAYVRALGASTGLGQCFLGPMAKQHRMAVVTLAALVAATLSFRGWSAHVMAGALAVITAGTLLTVVRRTAWIIRGLESR
jgi:phosphatidylglycerophosphate synthase